jgi:hypothetical protein
MASLTEVRAEIKQASEQLSALLNDSKADGSTIANMTAAINELGAKRDALEAVEREQKAADAEAERKAFAQASGGAPTGGETKPEVKSFETVLGEAVRKMAANPKQEIELGFDAKSFLEGKTVMSTGAGWAPESLRTPGATEYARERRYVTDVIPVVPINQAAYLFMEQTTRTSNAAEIAESTNGSLESAAESAFAYTERTETLRKITHFVPVTREQVEDVPGPLAELQAEMQRDQQKFQLEMQAKQAEIRLKQETAQIDARAKVQQAEIQTQSAQQQADIKADQARQAAEQSTMAFEQKSRLTEQQAAARP